MTLVVAMKQGMTAEATTGGENKTINSMINHSHLLILKW
jgi:hypothetical protein